MTLKCKMYSDANDMAVYSAPCVVAIYGVIAENSAMLIGTGTLIHIEHRFFILSAYHVMKTNQTYQYLGISAGQGRPPRRIFELNREEDEINDIVIVEILPESLEQSGKTPIRTEYIAAFPPIIKDSDLLFLQGFPGEFSQPKPINELHNTSLPLPVVTVDKDRRLDDHSIFIHYDRVSGYDSAGNQIPLPDPHSLSGSSLWHLYWSQENNAWKPNNARIIGVVKHWIPDYDMLVATRIDSVHLLISRYQSKPPA